MDFGSGLVTVGSFYILLYMYESVETSTALVQGCETIVLLDFEKKRSSPVHFVHVLRVAKAVWNV